MLSVTVLKMVLLSIQMCTGSAPWQVLSKGCSNVYLLVQLNSHCSTALPFRKLLIISDSENTKPVIFLYIFSLCLYKQACISCFKLVAHFPQIYISHILFREPQCFLKVILWMWSEVLRLFAGGPLPRQPTSSAVSQQALTTAAHAELISEGNS